MDAIITTCCSVPLFPPKFVLPQKRFFLGFTISPGLRLYGNHQRCDDRKLHCRATDDGRRGGVSPWECGEEPYEILPNGKRGYVDELDVATFLDPPKELIPFDPSSYNPAAYLWKKFDDIPEERRHNLLDLLDSRLISRAWEVAGMRYVDDNLAKKCASKLLSDANDETPLEFWNCGTSGGPVPLSWFRSFKKAIFCSNDGNVYGRFIDGSVLARFTNSLYPLYFMVKQCKEVLSTEQPCDLAYELGNGLLDLPALPSDFPKPVKHPYPLDDHIVIYIRHVGPGVMIGQAWQEGIELQQVPKKLCGEILMVKECSRV